MKPHPDTSPGRWAWLCGACGGIHRCDRCQLRYHGEPVIPEGVTVKWNPDGTYLWLWSWFEDGNWWAEPLPSPPSCV